MSDSTSDHRPSPAAEAEIAGAGRLDAASQEVAAVYAKALLSATETAGNTAKLVTEAEQIVDWLAGSPKFEQILASELLGDDEKQKLIDRVFAPRYERTLVDFLRVLSRRDRLGLLRPILREFGRQHGEVRGNVRVQVTTAAALPEAAAKQLAKALRPLVAGEPQLEVKVDPDLIGGAVVRVGDTVYDGSVARQLKRLESQMINRSVHEIQSRRDRFRHSGGN
ncbi:MAG TPA: ATP synthase F1 subunit delta [Pirellulales bacterium]|jgi:F-type H+-transporting ATPase subunit delta|nr:ATP synthase F1 subunit delta [Pirellulales bacterium]